MADQPRIVSIKGAQASSYADSRLKRTYDVVLALVLLGLSSPLLVPAIVLNSLVTGGHPIFVQRRAGKRGVEFDLYKLRTMRQPNGKEHWSHRTSEGDKRLTVLGKVLRRTYLDELPQLINVLLGQMSLVGPRPETLEMTQEIAALHPRFVERMIVKPGITGTAQIFFRKPQSDHDLWLRYYYDHLYVTKTRFRFDVELTVLTVWRVLRYKGQ